jgi:hypothetical protein
MANNGQEAAVDEATRLDEIGFPEFTSKLISDTFSAIVASMIDQQEAYADLVEKVAMTIEDFETEAVSTQDVDRWLAEEFPGGEDEPTAIQSGTSLDASQVDRLHTQLGDTAGDVSGADLPSSGSGTSLDDDAVSDIRAIVRRDLAEPRMDALESLVEQGVVRLVVDDGTIETDLKFHTYGMESTQRQQTSYDRDRWGVGGRAGFVSSMFGISARGGYNSISVSTSSKEDRAYSSSDVRIKGGVTINVKGDYQPLRVPGEGGGGGGGGGGG